MAELSYKVQDNGVVRDMTSEEKAEVNAKNTAWENDKLNRQLAEIRKIRNRKLSETDYMANSDVTMPDYIKTWRQTLSDLPQNNTPESQYNTLLERNTDGRLKNSVWKQPTE